MTTETTTHSVQVTNVEVCKVRIEFCIKKFDSWMASYAPGMNLWSEGVSSPLFPRAVWKLSVFPNGWKEEQKGKCNFFVYLTGPMVTRNESVDALVNIYLQHSSTGAEKPITQVQGKEAYSFNSLSYYFGLHQGVAHDTVKAALHNEEKDGSLLVVAEVEMLTPKIITNITDGLTLEKKELKIKQLGTIGELLRNGVYSDCSLVVGGETFPVHKALLSASSSIFAAMFDANGNYKEGREGVVRIEEFDARPVKAMLDFIYRGEINLSVYPKTHRRGVEADVLRLADKYALLGLKAHVEGRLAAAGIATPAQLAEMVSLADLYNCPALMKACAGYIARKRKSVCASPEWEELKSKTPKLAFELLEMHQ